MREVVQLQRQRSEESRPIRPVCGTISRRIIERPGEGHGSVQAAVAVGEHPFAAHVEQ